MHPVGRDSVEIFRFEYHPVDDVPHRFRVLLASEAGELRKVRERQLEQGWELVEVVSIEYFEFSDEASGDADL